MKNQPNDAVVAYRKALNAALEAFKATNADAMADVGKDADAAATAMYADLTEIANTEWASPRDRDEAIYAIEQKYNAAYQASQRKFAEASMKTMDAFLKSGHPSIEAFNNAAKGVSPLAKSLAIVELLRALAVE